MRKFVIIFLILFGVLETNAAFAADRVTIFAAASLKEAMDRIAVAFQAETGVETVISFAASSILARQIEAGAPADIFISADEEWMDYLAERDLIDRDSRRLVLANALVIAAAGPFHEKADPETILAEGRFAMGDPSHVPAGRYAQAALSSLGFWENVRKHAVFGENVRVVLELARRGEVTSAIVYRSDLHAAPGLFRIYTFPPNSHPPIVYPAAAVMPHTSTGASAFLDFLSGKAAEAIFRELGFTPLPPS
ncbi:molybdate ABC transporter substrate-binding protein [Chelativorans sp. Marseille-P2723]|uniref:molybdate ABC transporter substrate-binding protein n=1 Tax=Chelativorans sp. Marseille-P2723 TaxID=2709133 RepID=UPI00156FB479|nr:molybdate ABC transporter substrate-binding protein [Chelativorans sp. Marseille-P2723]